MRSIPKIGDECYLVSGVVRHGVDVSQAFRVTFVDAGFIDPERVEIFIEQDVASAAWDGSPRGTMSTMVTLRDIR